MKKANILICDDEQGVRESFRIILGKEFDLSFATNGEEAVDYVKTHDPDLLILDVKMPKMTGLEALRAIKQLKPGVRVLMITGYESSDVANQAANLGADDYTTKPFDALKILSQIRTLLDRK